MFGRFLFSTLLFWTSPVLSQEEYYLRSSSESIFKFTQDNANFSTLATALELADLNSVLDCEYFFCPVFTVFAPNNEAFEALPEGTLDRLTTPDFKRHLHYLLLYHVAPQTIRASDIEDGDTIDTLLLHNTLNATVSNDGVQINSATVVAADIENSNGVIHAIDQVLIPDFLTKDVVDIAQDANRFSILLAAVEAAGLTGALKGFTNITLFAPTNAAFEKLGSAVVADLLEDTATLVSILTYHVVEGVVLSNELEEGDVPTLQGESVSIEKTGSSLFSYHRYPVLNGEIRLERTDILASNGVIHVIEDVLIPPSITPPTPTIAEIAAAEPDLSTLVEALGVAGLVDVLSDEGPFTVFAPVNSAFEKLGNAVVANLLGDSETLTSVLSYHVVEDTILSDGLEEGMVPTLQGESITVDERGFWIFKSIVLNDDIHFKTTDIIASNGVIHLIEGVLIPPSAVLPTPTISEVASAEPSLSTLVGALDIADLVETLGGEGPFTVFAPTNSAFSKLNNDTLYALLDDTSALASVLLYHVISGSVKREDLEEGSVTTLNGAAIEVDLKGWGWSLFTGFLCEPESRLCRCVESLIKIQSFQYLVIVYSLLLLH